MGGEKRKKRSHSTSRSREKKMRKTEERLENLEKQISNLTSLITKTLQPRSEVTNTSIINQECSVETVTNKEVSNNENLFDVEPELEEAKSTDGQKTEQTAQVDDRSQKETFLHMLGEHPNTRKEIYIKINEELKIRWQKWMQEGYPENNKKTIMDIYPRKDDLYTEAPKVNLEITPIMTENTIRRDEHFVETQNCVGSVISALGAAVSMIIEEPEDGVDQEELMKFLCDSGKLLTDVFHKLSLARRAYITPLMSKSIKPTVDATKTDEWLYGKKFADIVKEVKEVEKACSNIKAATKTTGSKPKNQGNLRYPPAKNKQVGYQSRKTIKFKPRSQRTNYNTTKPSNRPLSRYTAPKN